MLKKVLEYFNKSWYHLIDNKGEMNNMEQMKGIFDARVLACFIIEQYSKFTNNTKEITNIKLQKSLYFLLAYWGGFVNSGVKSKSEIDMKGINPILFSNRIEAWVYGPVVPDVFYAQKDGTLDDYNTDLTEQFENIPMLEESLKSLLNDIFSVADFKLVSTSHDDMSWRNHFNAESQYHNEQIPQQEIIEEYTLKNAV